MYKNIFQAKMDIVKSSLGANSTIVSDNASAVKFYTAKSSLVRSENKKISFEKRSSLLHRCLCTGCVKNAEIPPTSQTRFLPPILFLQKSCFQKIPRFLAHPVVVHLKNLRIDPRYQCIVLALESLLKIKQLKWGRIFKDDLMQLRKSEWMHNCIKFKWMC
jgi:hypothetical protein